MYNGKKLAVILLAGGTGKRSGAEMPKQFLKMADTGKSMLEMSARAFLAPEILPDVIIVTSPAGYEEETSLELEKAGAGVSTEVIPGGKERQDSVRNAVKRLGETGFDDDGIVLTHDAARPFVTKEIIEAVISRAAEKGAAIAAVPVKNTIRDIEKGTLERGRLYEVQTPQGFRYGILKDALISAYKDGFTGTDDAGLVERTGLIPEIVPGSYGNIKITTPEDLALTEKGPGVSKGK